MRTVINQKPKLAFKLGEPCDLKAEKGDRLILDRVSEVEGQEPTYVAYVVPQERYRADFTEVPTK